MDDECSWLVHDATSSLRTFLASLQQSTYMASLRQRVTIIERSWRTVLRYSVIILLGALLVHINPHAHASQVAIIAQLTNLAFAFVLITIFVIKQTDFRLLRLLGVYSFEFYLLHWPLISRYDLLFSRIPAWIATLCYLVIILGLGYLLQLCSNAVWERLQSQQTA